MYGLLYNLYTTLFSWNVTYYNIMMYDNEGKEQLLLNDYSD